MPGIVKIGATLRSPEDRLNEARSVTWAPSSFCLIAHAAVEDAFGMEAALHAMLAHRRVEARREFFELTHAEARALFDTVALLSGPRAGREAREPQSEAVRARGAATAEEKLRAWVDSKYTRIPLREKDTGSKLEALHTAYASAALPVHQSCLGKTTFGRMLCSVYPGVGPHRGSAGETGLFLLR
jgi:hypothetical protein